MAKKITAINPVEDKQEQFTKKRLKVCGYARVSTGSLAQAESYTTQVEYYTRKIENNPLWEFAGVYADEGISGKKIKKRKGFQEMLQACEEGDVDLILTKSITRFARNTIDCLKTVRKLKAMGIGVYFEKENINTLLENSELALTVFAAVAQSESQDYAGNNRWAVIERFENGTFNISTLPYGYRKAEEHGMVIEESEAEIVRLIFEEYLNGLGAYLIAKMLNYEEVPSPRESEQWGETSVRTILTNPVYEGNALWQKTYTETEYPYTKKKNYGQRNMYFAEDAYPAIITHETAESVRNLMKYRIETLHANKSKNNRYLFTSRIICEDCGSNLRRQKVEIGKPSEKILWICRKHATNKDCCQTKAVREDVLQHTFINVWNKLYTNQGAVLEPLLKGLKELAEKQEESEEIKQLNNEIQNLSEQSRILNQVMTRGYMDSAIFMEKNNELAYKLTESKRKRTLLIRKMKRSKEIVRTEQLIDLLEKEGYLTQFREELFDRTVESIRISPEREIRFCLYNGLVLTEKEGGDTDAVAYSDRI